MNNSNNSNSNLLNEREFVVNSLELNMFFARIMKEHAAFLEAGFTPANADFAKVADYYKQQFENLLAQAVNLGAAGIVSPQAVASREFVTDFTLGSEQKTTHFTGINLNTNITRQEANMWGSVNPKITPQLVESVRALNAQIMPVLNGLIDFKKQVIAGVTSCAMVTANFPSEGDHILHEAENYRQLLTAITNGTQGETRAQAEQFWNDKMKEHAGFIRGKLDPTEKTLFEESNNYHRIYEALLNSQAREGNRRAPIENLADSIGATEQFSNFKQGLTDGINRCQIKSVMLPLYADHILREANYYLRQLKTRN
jgi:hypothetical protein